VRICEYVNVCDGSFVYVWVNESVCMSFGVPIFSYRRCVCLYVCVCTNRIFNCLNV
jgi:hypothetical protein